MGGGWVGPGGAGGGGLVWDPPPPNPPVVPSCEREPWGEGATVLMD